MVDKGKRYLDEIRGQIDKNKHHIIKLLIALVAIPMTTTILDTYVLGDVAPIQISVYISVWATFVLLTIYDGVITRETQRAKDQIIENTLSIIVIEEDIRNLQREVYKGNKMDIRAQNYAKAKRRKGESLLGGDFDEARTKNKPTNSKGD